MLGQCVITACTTGSADCDAVAANGCEVEVDPTRGDCQSTIESCKSSVPVSKNAPDGTSCGDTGSCESGDCKPE